MSNRNQKHPKDPRPAANLPSVAFVIAILAVVGLIAFVWSSASVNEGDEKQPEPKKPKLKAKAPKWEVASAEDAVVDSFLAKRNEAKATETLLGRDPARAGDGPFNPDEAESLETDYFLREIPMIVEIRRTPVATQFVLVTSGNVAAPRLAIRQKTGEASNEQRTMSNPDLLVEVRDGKIYGIRSSLHHD